MGDLPGVLEPVGVLPSPLNGGPACLTRHGRRSSRTSRQTGQAREVHDRRVVFGIHLALKTGCRGCDTSPEYGPWTTIPSRLNRQCRRRFWTDLLNDPAASGARTRSM